MAEEEQAMSAEELIKEFVDSFDTAINVQTIASRSSIKEEADRYKMIVFKCSERKLPIYESLILGLSRKIELELVNFNDVARSLLKEQLDHKLPDYDEETLDEFTERATKIIHDESESLRNSLRSSYLEGMKESEKQITKEVKEFKTIISENDFRRRHRPTAMNMPLEPEAKKEKVDNEKEIERRAGEFNILLKTVADNFTNLLAARLTYVKTLIDANIKADLAVFGTILMHFNVEMWDHFKNQKQLVNSTVEEILSHLSRLSDQPDAFSVTALALQQKANQLYESIKNQLNSATSELDKYRAEERRDVFRRDMATRPDVDCVTAYIAEDEGDILFDGRIRRENAKAEIDLEGIEVDSDNNERISCELRKDVILNRIVDESEDVEVFAVQKYAHTNLLRCLGTGRNEGARYLVFDRFPDTLATVGQELGQDGFIQFLNALRQAVEYLHEKNLFHGDLRPENVYLALQDDGYKVKLAHFSMLSARETVERGTAEQNSFSAPEAGPEMPLLLLQKTDIWSFGSLIWHALTGITPCEQKIADLPSTIPKECSLGSIGALLKRCWAEQPENRPSIYEIGEDIINIVSEIAFTFEEESQWTEESSKWKSAAGQIGVPNMDE